jgi:hypothetical protein
VLPSLIAAETIQCVIWTEKGELRESLTSHPLTWWTENPLRLDTTGDLMIGLKAPDARVLTPHDYEIQQQLIPIGELAGNKILQVLTRSILAQELLLPASLDPTIRRRSGKTYSSHPTGAAATGRFTPCGMTKPD